MPTPNDALAKDALKDRLTRYREINLTVTGRKSGRAISQPVWFVLEEDKLYLLPVRGTDTQWYKNTLKNPTVGVAARGADAKFHAVPITDRKQVSSVVEKFRAKYGAGDVKKYYSRLDVAVVAQLFCDSSATDRANRKSKKWKSNETAPNLPPKVPPAGSLARCESIRSFRRPIRRWFRAQA